MLEVGRKSKINTWLAKGDRWIPAVYFLCVLALYLTMAADSVFVDELDVFYGGYNIVKSGDLYRFYPSQHMPFSYYFAALCALLGARSVIWFRAMFYVMLSGLWTGIYIRFRRHLPRLALLSLPVFYIVQLRMQLMGTTMMSDHWQGIGLLIVLLEMLVYADQKRITAGAACMISLGIVLSFGTTFLSAFPLFAIFLGVVAMQAVQIVRKERELSGILKEDGRLVLICLCPFLLLLGWYAASGNLQNAIDSAYNLNVHIYSKYMNGFGSSASRTILGAFPYWFEYQYTGYTHLANGELLTAAQIWIPAGTLLVFTASLWHGKKRIPAVTFFLAVLLTGVRALDGFHGMPYIAVTCAPLAFCMDGGLSFFLEKRSWRRAIPAVLALACTLVLTVPQIETVMILKFLPLYLQEREYPESNREILEILAEPGERIHTDDISTTSLLVMRNDLRLEEASLGASNPWFYEHYGERELQVLKDNKTRIVLYEPDGDIWGYVTRDYAPDLTAYIEENYTLIAYNIYVRNEEYPAAVEKLRQHGYGIRLEGPEYDDEPSMGPFLEPGQVFEQRFVATGRALTAVYLRIATYVGQNRSGVTVELADAETGEKLAESTLRREEIRDSNYSRFTLKAETEPGRTYAVRVRMDEEIPEGEDSWIKLYIKEDREEANGYIDGERQNFDWNLQVEYGAE